MCKKEISNLKKGLKVYYEPRIWGLVPEAKSQGIEIMIWGIAVLQFVSYISIKGEDAKQVT